MASDILQKQIMVSDLSDPTRQHSLAYHCLGDRSKPLLLCVHGLTRRGSDFYHLVNTFKDTRYLICVDVPGRGASAWLENAADYILPQYVADMRVLIEYLCHEYNVETIDYIGTSMGGLIGMLYAGSKQDTPSRIRRIIINDIGPHVPWTGIQRIGAYIGNVKQFDSHNDGVKHVATLFKGFGTLTQDEITQLHGPMIIPIGRNHESDATTKYTQHYDPAIAIAFKSMTEAQAVADECTMWKCFEQIQADILLIRGTTSDLCTTELAKEMCLRNAKCRVVCVPQVGHAPPFLSPAQLDIIESFFVSRGAPLYAIPCRRELLISSPRLEYPPPLPPQEAVLSWGQRKLLLMELEFITTHAVQKDTIVYAGAAPGTHLPYLFHLTKELNLTWELYDIRCLDTCVLDAARATVSSSSGLSNIRIHVGPSKGHFDETKANHYHQKLQDGLKTQSILFISDVRTSEQEDDIHSDMLMQMDWVRLMCPRASLLKFRLPWTPGSTPYLMGRCLLQPYTKKNSTETRLLVHMNPDNTDIYASTNTDTVSSRETKWKTMVFDHATYWEQMCHHNSCRYEQNYDSHRESQILTDYCLRFQETTVDGTAETVTMLSEALSSELGALCSDEGQVLGVRKAVDILCQKGLKKVKNNEKG
jgi:pimeloyl-ACP methyl ester carboxylesterase